MVIHTRNPTVFVTILSLMGLVALFVSGIEWWQWAEYSVLGQPAQLTLIDPNKKPMVIDDKFPVPVHAKYVFKGGELVVPNLHVRPDIARALKVNNEVSVIYKKSDPRYPRWAWDLPEPPWGWTLAAGVMVGLALLSLKLYKREAPAFYGYGPDDR